MQTLQCEIKELKEYEIKTWESGCCTNLAGIKIFDNVAIWDYSGCVNITDFVKPNRKDGVTDGIIKVLSILRKITESFMIAEDYLIDETSISMDLDKIWLDTRENIVKLLPGKSSESYINRVLAMLNSIEAINHSAIDIAERIKEKNSESVMSYRDFLKFISSWELELI